MQFTHLGYIKKGSDAAEAPDHNEFHKVAKTAYKKALAKNGGDTYHAKKEAQLATIDAGASPDMAAHHAAMVHNMHPSQYA